MSAESIVESFQTGFAFVPRVIVNSIIINKQTTMAKCGVCEFKGSTEEYLKHKCSTGFKPTDIKHQDALTNGRFSKQSEKALERGEARK